MFKVGDEVIWRNPDNSNGNTYNATVTKVIGSQVYVRFHGTRNNTYVTSYNERFFQHKDTPMNTGKRYIISVEENGKLAPNASPREYKSLEQAKKVALEMAEKHGKRFFVLVATTVAEPPVKPKAELKELV